MRPEENTRGDSAKSRGPPSSPPSHREQITPSHHSTALLTKIKPSSCVLVLLQPRLKD